MCSKKSKVRRKQAKNMGGSKNSKWKGTKFYGGKNNYRCEKDRTPLERKN